MKTFYAHILEADRALFEGQCESMILPTVEGQYGVLANHRNVITAIVPGKLTFREPGGENVVVSVSPGIMKVEDNDVLVLVDSAEFLDEIDINRANEEAEIAREHLLQKQSIQEYKLAQGELARALNRLKIKKG